MFRYSETTEKSTSVPERPVRRIRGQFLARAHLSRRQRAKIAADLVEGTAVIAPPTIRQAAMVAGVPVVEVTKARRNGNGKSRRSSSKAAETLAQHIARSSLAERIEAARTVGVDVVWDSMISPVIATERTAG